MKVLLFGATGMVGQGVLRECLLDAEVTAVVTIGRRATGAANPKLREIVRQDLSNYDDMTGKLSGFDACSFVSESRPPERTPRTTSASPTASPSPRPPF